MKNINNPVYHNFKDVMELIQAQRVLAKMMGVDHLPSYYPNGIEVYFITKTKPLEFKLGQLIDDTPQFAVIRTPDGKIHKVSPFGIVHGGTRSGRSH